MNEKEKKNEILNLKSKKEKKIWFLWYMRACCHAMIILSSQIDFRQDMYTMNEWMNEEKTKNSSLNKQTNRTILDHILHNNKY